MRPKIIVCIDRGIVQQVITDCDIDLIILDYDLDGLSENEISTVAGHQVYRYKNKPLAVNPDLAGQIHDETRTTEEETACFIPSATRN